MIKILNSLKKNSVIMIATVISISVGFVIISIGMILYKNRISKIGYADSSDYINYKYQFALISEESDAPFWEAIYEGALDKGKELDIYVERTGSSLPSVYPLQDLMKIAIASKVDRKSVV